jgi:hypothetical protein
MTDLLFIGWKRLRSFSRTRQLALLLGFALAVGVPSWWFGGGVALKTGGISGGSGAVGCYTSGTIGELVADPVAGTAIIERSGRRIAVTWPRGWTGRRSGWEVEVVNASNAVVLRTGTRVSLMGGYYSDGSFLTCGGQTLP